MIQKIARKLQRMIGIDFGQALQQEAAARTMHARYAILAEPRNADSRRLIPYGSKAYSQNDEDGIIAEIFKRIGTDSKRFLEIGVAASENNTLALLLQGWTGAWIDGSAKAEAEIRQKLAPVLQDGRLKFVRGMVTRDSVDSLLESAGAAKNLDLFSLDIDGNEYHILDALNLTARVVIVEYNAKFIPPISWKLPYNPQHVWDFDDYSGASLQALETLMTSKGYALVGCNITGINAFFVRKDLLGEGLFHAPYTAENHYEPQRYWMLTGMISGYPSSSRIPLPSPSSQQESA